jgi:hypothetical protein
MGVNRPPSFPCRFAQLMLVLCPSEELERELGLREAVALNRNAMVGICNSAGDSGERRPQYLLAWVAGAALSLLDGLEWAELGVARKRALKTSVYFFLETVINGYWQLFCVSAWPNRPTQ